MRNYIKFQSTARGLLASQMSDLRNGVVYDARMNIENNCKAHKNKMRRFGRTRFLAATILSSPLIALVYSPFLIAQTVAGIAVPFATGHFIDALVGGMSPTTPVVLLAALLAVRAVMTPCLQRLVLSCARGIELRLQGRVLNSVMDFSPYELSTLADGSLVAKLTRDAYAVGGFVSGFYPRLITAVVTMLAAGVALYSRSPALGLSFVAFIPLCIVLFIPFARRFAANSHAVRKKSDAAFAGLFDFFQSLPFLRTLDAERRFADSPRQSMHDLKNGNCAMDGLSIAFGALLGALLVIGEVSVLGVAGALAAKGAVPVGDVVVYQLLFLSAMQSVQGIVSLLPETASLREGIDSLNEIFSHPEPRRGDRHVGNVTTIEFRNVTFSYPNAADRPVVKDLSATFRTGKIYALAGANGTGKTTLLKLATATLEPQAGEILVNGTPLESLDACAFRRGTGIVFQDSLFVTGTIRDNITLRDPMFGEEDVKTAVVASGLEEVVSRLPAGLDTRLGLRGQALSGGELQRLAIARALVRNPSVLVLDEVTNHLDAKARASFETLLLKLAPGRIVLVVSHDPAIIDLCDEKIFCQIP